MDHLGLIPDDKRNYFALSAYDLDKNKDTFVNFINEKNYPPACEFCNRDSGIFVERAKQIERKICNGILNN